MVLLIELTELANCENLGEKMGKLKTKKLKTKNRIRMVRKT